MIPAEDALKRLIDGNARYVAGESSTRVHESLAAGQQPFAAVLACADSRVPVEMVFDHGPGDIFVVRVAGNIACPTQLESIEYAVDVLEAKLVVVLGHTGCGAVAATLSHIASGGGVASRFGSLIDEIRPAIDTLIDKELDTQSLANMAVRANVQHVVDRVRQDLQRFDGKAHVVGAIYSLENGVVEFLDGGVG